MLANNFQIHKKSLFYLFDVIKKTFPFRSNREFYILKENYNKLKKGINNNIDDETFFNIIKDLLLNLKDSHTKLGWYPTKRILYNPIGYNIIYIGKNFYLFNKYRRLIGKILKIDGQNINSIFTKYKKRLTKNLSPQFSKYLIIKHNLLSSEFYKPILVTMSDGKEIIIKREKTINQPLSKIIKAKIINKKIGYLKIAVWSGDDTKNQIDKKIKYFIKNKIKSLIIDLRGNSGGDSRIAKHFAGYFFNKKVLFGIIKERVSQNNFKLKKRLSYVEPKDIYLDLPIILLIDEACFSSNEYFIAGMKDNKRAFLIGRKTGGGSGNPKKFIIPYGNNSFEISISTWIYFRPNKMLLESNGIKPHLSVKLNLNDLIKNRDKILELAIQKANTFVL